MIAALALAICVGPAQVRTEGLPKFVYESPIIGGQREIILGPKPIGSVLLNGFLERDFTARHLANPSNTGGYVDSWIPGGTHEENLGYFDCVTRPSTLFDQPCVEITTTARWNQKIGKKPNQITVQNTAKQQYWISPAGRILRHYAEMQTPEGKQIGDCAYGKGSVQRRYTDVHGKTSFGELFPTCGMDGLNAQFTPMFADGKVLKRDKEFWIANPLTGGLDHYTVRVSGRFKGTMLNATFQGEMFDIDGPNSFHEQVLLDDKGDLVKVSLDDERYFVIGIVPPSHLDKDGHPIRGGGG